MADEKKENLNKPKRPYHRNTKNKKVESEQLANKKERVEKVEGNNQKSKKQPTKRTYNKNQTKFDAKKSNLKIIPLGGLEEIGNNMTIFEYEDEIIIVDCGLEFPTDDMLGVDLVIPDVTYLERNKEKIKGFVRSN